MKMLILFFVSFVFAKDIQSLMNDKVKADPTVSWPAHGFNVTFGKETGYVNVMINMIVDWDNNRVKVTTISDFLEKEREMF